MTFTYLISKFDLPLKKRTKRNSNEIVSLVEELEKFLRLKKN